MPDIEVRELLDDHECQQLFNNMISASYWKRVKSKSGSAKHGRKQAFFGHIIGSKSFPKALSEGERCLIRADGVRYKINDLDGKTRFCRWTRLVNAGSPIGRKVRDGAKQLLIEMLGADPSATAYLQCNVNAYSRTAELPWHRDDCTNNLNAPTTDTFEPAAVTLYILGLKHKSGGEFAYADPLSDRKDPEIAIRLNSEDREENYDPQRCSICSLSEPGRLIGISKDIYAHGLHRNTKIDVESSHASHNSEIVRVSLNFRFVKKQAYEACLPQTR